MFSHYWIVLPLKTVSNTFVRKVIAFLERYIKGLFGMPLESRTLPRFLWMKAFESSNVLIRSPVVSAKASLTH